MGRKITVAELKKHQQEEDCWLVIDGKVYDVSEFTEEHPGGEQLIMDMWGKDATEGFNSVVHSDAATEILEELYLGDLVQSKL